MRALSLFSGGLDSQLAVLVMKHMGIEVIALHFTTPFFGGSSAITQAAADLGIELREINISEDYIPRVLLNPVYGYGKNFNPCIDCHAYMLHHTGSLMEKMGASFIITGEVVGQRPMSQNKAALNAVDKLAGYKGYVVRPLSGRLLPPTIPEQEGWIERDALLDIQGRSRTRQMELAEKYGLKDYPSPAGGCLLTEPNFARRIRHLLQYRSEPTAEEMQILRLGRHLYLKDGVLLVVGRNHSENERIPEAALKSDMFLKVADRPGPLALLRSLEGEADNETVELAARIVARYSDAKNEDKAHIKRFYPGQQQEILMEVSPLPPEEVPPTV